MPSYPADPPPPPPPPRLAEALLERLLPPALRGPYLGDLREDFAELHERRGALAARLWYLTQVLRSRPWALARAEERLHSPHRSHRRPGGPMTGFIQDVRASLRSVRRTPLPSAVIVLTVALAMASATLVFSIYEGVILRPFPYAEPEELVDVHLVNPVMAALDDPASRQMGERYPLSYPVFEAWRSAASLPLASFGAYQGDAPLYQDNDTEQQPLNAASVTAGVFEVLGVPAALGRLPAAAEDVIGGPATAVLTHPAWQMRFGGDSAVVGRDVRLGERTFRVIGVMPPGFYFPTARVDVLTSFSDGQRATSGGAYFLRAIGRLRAGMDVTATQLAMDDVVARAGTTIGRGPAGVRVADRRAALLGDVELALQVLMVTVLVVVLMASVNVTNLLLARSTGRAADAALRRALGAGAGRLLRLQLVETLLLVAAGALVGTLAAVGGLDASLALLPEALPRQDGIAFNGAVAAFALLVTLAAAVLATLAPAWFAARSAPAAALRAAGGGLRFSRAAGRAQRALVVVEITAAVVLLMGAALLARSYLQLTSVPLGFDPHGMVVVPVYTTPSFARDGEAVAGWEAAVRDQVAALPGVADVVVSGDVPFAGGTGLTGIEYERIGGGVESISVANAVVSPGYFEFMEVPLLEGRFFAPGGDPEAEGGVIVNRPLADQLWGEGPAVGRRVRTGEGEDPWLEVIGVVAGMRTQNPAEPPGARLYQRGSAGGVFYVAARTRGAAASMMTPVRATVLASRADLQSPDAFTIEDRLATATAHPRFRTTLLASLAFVAAILALLGVYGVVSHAVAERRREIGVRMALGADGRRVRRAVLAQGLALGALGIGMGLLIATGTARYIRGFLFEVETSDPVAMASVVLTVLAVAGAAAYLPARRAAAVDPGEALRAE